MLTWFERGGKWSRDALGGLALRALLRDPKQLAALQREAGPLADES